MRRSDHYSFGDKLELTSYFISISASHWWCLRGCESSAAARLRRNQAADLEVKISLSHYTPPETHRLPLLCFLRSLAFISIFCFNLLSTAHVPVKAELSMQSSKYVHVVCSPCLGTSGAFWPFVKRFSKVYLAGFHIITLAGQILIRSGEMVLREGAGGGESSSVEIAQLFFLQGNGD